MQAQLSVPDISCEHCQNTITKALTGQPGLRSVRVDIPAKQVFVDYDDSQLSLDRVKEILAEEDFPADSATTV